MIALATNTRNEAKPNTDGPSSQELPKLLLKEAEAAKMLNISKRLLWSLNNQGLIACIWLGKAKRYSVVELERYIRDETARAGGYDRT